MSTPQSVRGDEPLPRPTDSDRTPSWVSLIAGSALFLLGLVILLLPGLTTTLVIRFVGIFWLVDGVVELVSIFMNRAHWPWKLLLGLLSVVGGITVIQYPLWSPSVAPVTSGLAIGLIGILIGLVQLILATYGSGWRAAAPGFVSLVFGGMTAFAPTVGAAYLPLTLGGLALAGGVATAVRALKPRAAHRGQHTDAPSA